ncbi:MAG TPA: peptidoglycan-binding domain-containing protein [Candidatus Paceibacterota bacterium]|nr:peptidoglycan-binding domain-containing protein [Candidatus Paceibacterota bacterium]
MATVVHADDNTQSPVVTEPSIVTETPSVPDLVITTDTDETQSPDVSNPDIDTQTPSVPTITIEATKVICDTDDYSPHLGNGTSITATTASDYVANSNGHCHLAPNWRFQWSYQDTNPTDVANDFIGEASGDWNTFGPTDANGSTTVTVPFPNTVSQYHVREVLQTGYIPFTFNESTRDNSNSDSAEFYCETDGLNYDNFEYIRNPVAGTTYHCVAFNVPTTPATTPSDGGGNGGGGGSSGILPTTILGGSGSGGTSGGSTGGKPAGQVLGASTDTPNSCGEYITSYVKLGAKNDKQNVTNLQAFLNYFIHANIKIDGSYGPQTFAAVKQFQEKESVQVLVPWKNLGNPNLVGTGYVYKTTKRDINNIVCPSLNLPMPQLP